jgi:hypothetical protein
MPFKSRAFLYGKFFPDGHECNKVDGIPLHLSVLKVCFPDVITSGFCLIGRKKKHLLKRWHITINDSSFLMEISLWKKLQLTF